MGKLLQQISGDLMITVQDLEHLVQSAPYRYKVYDIPKRQSGKMRTIAQPARAVKGLQRWVIANILTHYPVHPAAMAYRKRKSIATNARVHAKQKFLLKLDFKDFFHSIKAGDFKQFVEDRRSEQIDVSDVRHLVRILFWMRKGGKELVLSIGAPSSPMLSNILMYEFDRQLTEHCKSAGVTYTRYADDLTFSTNARDVLQSVEQEVDRVCHGLPYPRLSLNREKRVHASKKGSRRVTGLVLSNDGSVSIGHERKRELHAAVHHFKQGKLKIDEITALAGTLAFVHSVEPRFLLTLGRKYGEGVVSKLMKANRPA